MLSRSRHRVTAVAPNKKQSKIVHTLSSGEQVEVENRAGQTIAQKWRRKERR